MRDSRMIHADGSTREKNHHFSELQDDFVAQVEARIHAMERAAQDLVDELGLPAEAKYDVLSGIAVSLSSLLPTERDYEEIAHRAYEAYDGNSEVQKLLEQNDAFIIESVWGKIPRDLIRPDFLNDEVDDIAQCVRIKFWEAFRVRHIKHIRAYIYTIVQMECINIARRRHSAPLPLDADGELLQGSVVLMSNQGAQDPVENLEQEETLAQYITATADAVLSLPPVQCRAMICALKDKIDDILRLSEAFKLQGMDIEEIDWPEKPSEKQAMRASLSVARKSLQKRIDWEKVAEGFSYRRARKPSRKLPHR